MEVSENGGGSTALIRIFAFQSSSMNVLSLQNKENIRLHLAEWPTEPPRAVIALVHGQGEHIGRYAHLAAWYNRQGVAVVGLDLQGHGRSEGRRGHVRDLDALFDDIGLLLDETRRRYPQVPLFLYGHSMGGNLTLHYTARRQPALHGLIATSPWIRLAFEAPALKVMAGRLLRHFLPTLSLPTGLTARFIAQDAAVVRAYETDPLVHNRLSASAGIVLLESAAWLNRYSGKFPTPLLLLHGTGDRIVSAPATREFFGRVSGDVTHHEWPDLYHELHNEREQEAVFAYTLAWLEKRIAVDAGF